MTFAFIKRKVMSEHSIQIVIPCSKTMEFIEISSIVRCEAMQNYTAIHLKDDTRILSSCNIGIYKDALSPLGFFTCHKSHVINTNLIKRYHREGFVEMVDQTQVPISRRKKSEFIDKIIKTRDLVLGQTKMNRSYIL